MIPPLRQYSKSLESKIFRGIRFTYDEHFFEKANTNIFHDTTAFHTLKKNEIPKTFVLPQRSRKAILDFRNFQAV